MLSEKINEYLSGKAILILGFGREGKSTLDYIIKHNVKYTKLGIADSNTAIEKVEGINYHLGSEYLESISEYDIVFKTPGISLKDVDISKFSHKITSQAEMLLKFGKEKIIGITGTKGKSTTSNMIHQMLCSQYKVNLVGNIGIPALDFVDKYDNVDYFVYELSSHQLELVDSSPKIAVFLNLYEEHLDYYSSFDAYANSKRNIFKYQTEKDTLIYNLDMERELLQENDIKSQKIGISQLEAEQLPLKNKIIHIDVNMDNVLVLGKHNLYNLTVAATVAKLLGISDENILNTINTIKPLPHRLEKFEVNNKIFIDDSISTIPEATISAMESLKNVSTVLIGGMDRGINYNKLVDYLKDNVTINLIFMYDSGKRIFNKLTENKVYKNMYYVDNLELAVQLAIKLTPENSICLLSPAAASYGFFKNFEERGEKFKELVKNYSSHLLK